MGLLELWILICLLTYAAPALGQGIFRVKPLDPLTGIGNTQVVNPEQLFGDATIGVMGHPPTDEASPSVAKSVKITEKAIQELCGTSSSVNCAIRNDLLSSAEKTKGGDDTWERCQARKEFLDCIEAERVKCKNLAENGYFPLLPPTAKIKIIQDNAWKRFWTSGGCVLQA